MSDNRIHNIPVADIKTPEGRYRTDMGDIESLAQSITDVGQVTPIIINQDNVLIAGERRLLAHKHAGLETIMAIVRTSDDIDHRVVEIIENLERKEFTWQEEIRAKKDLHEMLLSKNPNWTGRDTANHIGAAASGIYAELGLAEAIDEAPEVFEGCRNKHEAFKALKKFRVDETMAEIMLRRSKTDYGMKARDYVQLGDCCDLVDKLAEGTINAVISDPFYGLNISDVKKTSSNVKQDIYEDSPELYARVMSTFISKMPRILTPNAWVLIFCRVENFTWLKEQLEDVGIKCDSMPGIWHRTGSSGQTNTPNHTFARSYEVFVYGHRGDAVLNRAGQANILTYPGVPVIDKLHPVQKPLPLMEDLITRMCLPGHNILDFMCGSGTTLVAAIKSGCIPIGFELDPHRYPIAIDNVSDALKMKDSGRMDLIEEE